MTNTLTINKPVAHQNTFAAADWSESPAPLERGNMILDSIWI